ncbi:uncharacterized protein LOC128679219 [Plodia interpunctella]|uniref:uncharacterized protein LOC128679219 n=1 Tax=Plodia interpunctella TaxID=58824 RepID=UPI002368E14A|nr:uncharacterized protein LOC128679219 [Plodia interpunctella]
MDSLALHILFILLKLCCVEASLKAEQNCAKMTRWPFYNPDHIVGKWRVYYTWGSYKKPCLDVVIKPMTQMKKNQLTGTFKRIFVDEHTWTDSELMVSIGRSEELILFNDGEVPGRYRALVNAHRLTPADKDITMANYAVKAFKFFKYLILLNCDQFSGFLMGKFNDKSVSAKEIISLVDDVLPGEHGHFSCIPHMDGRRPRSEIIGDSALKSVANLYEE